MSYDLRVPSYELRVMSYELQFMSCGLHSGVTFQTEGVNYRLQDADYSRGIHGAGCRWGGGWLQDVGCRLPFNAETFCI